MNKVKEMKDKLKKIKLYTAGKYSNIDLNKLHHYVGMFVAWEKWG